MVLLYFIIRAYVSQWYLWVLPIKIFAVAGVYAYLMWYGWFMWIIFQVVSETIREIKNARFRKKHPRP